MLALRGKSQVGNMLHVVVGPETELFGDIHGATVLNITPLLMEMDGNESVYLTLTNCKSEQATSHRMTAASMAHLSSFGSNDGETSAVIDEVIPAKSEKTVGSKPAAVEPKGKCEYCDQPVGLLPVPGFKICTVCAQIELGRLKQNTGDTKDGPAAT